MKKPFPFSAGNGFTFLYHIIQVSQVWEFIEVKEVITPYGRSGS